MSNEPFLFWPVRDPINQNNLFGANPAQYRPLGQAGHPGNDFESVTGTPIYSSCDGNAFYCSDSLGGDGIWIRTAQEGRNYNIILWHMPTPGTAVGDLYPFMIPTDRSIVPVVTGQLLGYTDNSGFPGESTGQHLHLGVMPANENWTAISPQNGFLGCVDPQPFYAGKFAEDVDKEEQLIQKSAAVVKLVAASTDAQVSHQEKMSVLQQLENFMISLLKNNK